MSHIHFIGAGQMAEAIIRAAIRRQAVSAGEITLSDIDPQRVLTLRERYQLTNPLSEHGAIAGADYIVMGVRPQDDIAAVAETINRYAAPQATVISIIAGVTLAQLASLLGAERPIVRTIPNTLTDTGLGYSGVVCNAQAKIEPLRPFLESFGKVMMLEERLIDVFTGYAVAGVNYVYYFIESLADAGVLAGLPRQQATQVAWENLVGAVEMLKASGCHPRQLMDINNSPAGVGINGLYELNNSDFAAGLQRSVMAAVRRTTALSSGR
ncbi:pyrroline-5-carboxylate reductase family protein [Musicola paradisiaca]|uniref:Pyrroline-5-carboxylate reductase n=1 Tax=Musicola paradisiaca (strain Ech703) TaxID=579405 RepID=C6C518_MUSP7|nr:pyrroline-5-carboxylate reductase dimerization domain-containing protein [Musicola paradisiaca]ACS85628.1 pyrroline-5-carboxylate reductase [Musicola paradisiaca Ech703]